MKVSGQKDLIYYVEIKKQKTKIQIKRDKF